MSELEKRILNTFGRILPKLSKREQEKILLLGEGIAMGVGVLDPEDCSSIKAENYEEKVKNQIYT